MHWYLIKYDLLCNFLKCYLTLSGNTISGFDAYNNTEDNASVSSQRTCDSGIWSENGTGSRIFGSGAAHGHAESSSKAGKAAEGHSSGTKPKTQQKEVTLIDTDFAGSCFCTIILLLFVAYLCLYVMLFHI